ncbi:3-dehydro-L-gulonate 2-dehydrogenase [Chryseolinea lacunae]|uniref:3-dehydro-L-gulonate 2-dehydrogenase n=1 Tax=Chryseolinea lacunae TaxID=2801331 RepID=A0ABS1KX06_9BACT|nr:3-dehydro-L-gulonate 2-dehydrogenase [Chryseolinea lacunae]MBL0742821.1 3-dehydro-L-gulonate 2-dehydrogenase [Chryseolinea lacunae]
MAEATPEFIRIPKSTMEARFLKILRQTGFSEEKAKVCAEVFTANSVDGVYTHGVNRFSRFIKYTREGHILPQNEAVLRHAAGCLEQWDGQSGAGPLNALQCTRRAMDIAGVQGMGCVALAHTNHWMRGGTYGWKAAREGFAFIGWTNTTANMPAWGGLDAKLGNNPLVIAIPFQNDAIVLDMAMSQYSYGALDFYQLKNQQLPVPGGFTKEGVLTTDPTAIRESQRVLPIGYWKGSGLSLLLDMLAAILSGGLSTAGISQQKAETGISQVFIAIDLSKLGNYQSIATALQQIVDDYHQSQPAGKTPVIYPGERVLAVRSENTDQGIPVLKSVWDEIENL